MQMPIDDRILETLGESQLILSPIVISKNIDKSREEVSRRLSKMVDAGLVIRVERGYYKISDKGEAYLAGEADFENSGNHSQQ
jgi:predicted transcriptional regulator